MPGETAIVHQDSRPLAADVLFSLFGVYAAAGLAFGELHFLSPTGVPLITPLSWPLAAVLCGLMWAASLPLMAKLRERWFPRRISPERERRFVPAAALAVLLLVLCSDYFGRSFTFFADPVHRPVLFYAGALVFGLLSLFSAQRRGGRFLDVLLSPWMLLFFQALLCAAFLSYADYRLIFSDDHPSFLYRLQLLREQFPYLPFYNPDWNAGEPARVLSSGVVNVFLAAWPLLRFGPDIETLSGAWLYTALIPYLFVLIVPWSVFLAGRLLRLNRSAAVLGALLALGPSLTFFEWLLHYGTIGFLLSAGLTPLTLALVLRLTLDDRPPRWFHVAGLLVASFFCLSWSLSAIVFLPVAAVCLFCLRQVFSAERRVCVTAFLVLFVVLNAPWIWIFVREAKVVDFVSQSALPGAHASKEAAMAPEHAEETADVAAPASAPASSVAAPEPAAAKWARKMRKACKKLRQLLVQVNPLLLFCFPAGALVLRRRRVDYVLPATVLWLVVVAFAGSLVKPQLELRRMIVPAAYLMCVLAAAWIEAYLRVAAEPEGNGPRTRLAPRVLQTVLIVALLGSLVVSPLNAGAVYLNRSSERYIFANPVVNALTNAIREHGGDGRVFFLGFVLHELSSSAPLHRDGGHLAPLAKFADKPMFASHYYHARWGYLDPIPEPFRERGAAGTEEFLDLMNVSAVVTFASDRVHYCERLPNYTLVFSDEHTWMFTRRRSRPGWFEKGSGELVRADEDRLEVIPHDREVVLRFRYQPRLKVSPSVDASITPLLQFPEDLGGGKEVPFEFIKLTVSEAALARGERFVIGYHLP